TLTDSAGQKENRTVSRVVSARPIHIEVIPEMGALVQGVSNKVYIVTTYPDGRPAKTKLSFSALNERPQANALGVAVVSLPNVSGPLSLGVLAEDAMGLAGQRRVSLPCGQVSQDFMLRTDKAVYTSGETLELQALGGGKEPIFFDLIKDGQTLL